MPGVQINTKEDAYRLFDEAVTALTTTNFIITEKPITDLLRCLVYSDHLRLFIIDCKKGVDYEAELAAAVKETEGGGYLFVLPKSNKKIIALVTGLLHDFDTGVRSLTSFIQNFWPNVDNNQRYRLFCDTVLLPYREAFRQSFIATPRPSSSPIRRSGSRSATPYSRVPLPSSPPSGRSSSETINSRRRSERP